MTKTCHPRPLRLASAHSSVLSARYALTLSSVAGVQTAVENWSSALGVRLTSLLTIRPRQSAYTTLPVAKGLRSMATEKERLFPGIGPKSGEMLRAAGITSLSQLREIGAVRAYVMVKSAKCNPSLNFLWGLESLLTGEHWRDVARNHRTSLLLALEEADRNG